MNDRTLPMTEQLLKRARQFVADAGSDEDDSEVNVGRQELLADIDRALARPGYAQTPDLWRPIETAPKSSMNDYKAVPFIGWCPDETAPDGGDQRVVWWEPRMKKGAGCWWGDRDLEEYPTHWTPLPQGPDTSTVCTPDHEPGCQSGDFGPCDCLVSSPDRPSDEPPSKD